jgi:L-fuculose-phosphate aldolase
MEEKYVGPKFKVIFLSKKLSKGFNKEIKILQKFGKDLSKICPTKESFGNISARLRKGFVIKRAGAHLNNLKVDDFTFVKECTGNKVKCEGYHEPSSESRMHHQIYLRRSDVNFIAHLHDKVLLRKSNLLKNVGLVEWKPYGTLELARAVSKAAEKQDLIVIKKHGIVVLGKDANVILKLAKNAHGEII